MTKLKQQIQNDNAMFQKRKWDYLLGEDLGSLSSSSSRTSYKKSLQRTDSESPPMRETLFEQRLLRSMHVLEAIATSLKPPVSDHELTVNKRADILMFLASKNTPHNDLVIAELLRMAGVNVPNALL